MNMTDERLAEIKKLIEQQKKRRLNAVTAYNRIVPELVAEIERLRKEKKLINARSGRESGYSTPVANRAAG
jgi:hypothetical protein